MWSASFLNTLSKDDSDEKTIACENLAKLLLKKSDQTAVDILVSEIKGFE